MSTLAREMGASYAFIERNVNLIKRYLGWEVVFTVYNVAQALVIGFIGVSMTQGSGQSGTVFYLLVGSLVWGYLAMIFTLIGEMITWERWEGTIEYTFMAPISRVTQMLGTVVFAVIYGILRTGLTLAILTRFFDLDLSHANLPAAIVSLVVASVGFVGLGIMISVLPLLFTERGTQMIFISQSCILLVSGVFYPIEVMPGWMQLVSWASPATYALIAARRTLLEGASLADIGDVLIPLLLVGVVMVPLGMTIFSWAERYAKRTGKLKRNG